MGFGNFLSKGIAADFEYEWDEKPYDDAREYKIKEAKLKQEERKAQQKEDKDLYESLKMDYSKIHPAYHKKAEDNFAKGISAMAEARKKGDVRGFADAQAGIGKGYSRYVRSSSDIWKNQALDSDIWNKSDELHQDLNMGMPDDEILAKHGDYIGDYDPDAGTFIIDTYKNVDPSSFVDEAFQGLTDADYAYKSGEMKDGKRRTVQNLSPGELNSRKQNAVTALLSNPNNANGMLKSVAKRMGMTKEEVLKQTGETDIRLALAKVATDFVEQDAAERYQSRYGDETPAKTTTTKPKKGDFATIINTPSVVRDKTVTSKPTTREVKPNIDYDAEIKKTLGQNPKSIFTLEEEDKKVQQDFKKSMLDLGFNIEEEAPGWDLGFDEIYVTKRDEKGKSTGKGVTLKFDRDEDDEVAQQEQYKNLLDFISSYEETTTEPVPGETLIVEKAERSWSDGYTPGKIINLEITKDDILETEEGGQRISFDSQNLPVRVVKTIMDEDGSNWIVGTVFALENAKGDIDEAYLKEMNEILEKNDGVVDESLLKPKLQKTVYIKDSKSQRGRLSGQYNFDIDQIGSLFVAPSEGTSTTTLPPSR